MTLERDYKLHGRYRIEEILGEGGMGAVYKAKDESLGVTVAVKENLFTTEEYSRQFRIEATILASLRHPNLTRVTDHFEETSSQYLVMDYIEGEDLRHRLERAGILDDSEIITVGMAICDALSYLHSRIPTILHRDVKPGNVKIAPNGQVYLVDFGLAKIVHGSQITITGARAMTPGYSPPEQYGTARTDARSDVYSLGATLYSALTGALPEDGLARAMNQSELTPIRQHNPKVSRKLSAAIEKALAVQPEDRFQNAERFRKALSNSRGITRRRLSEEDLTISPPPDMEEGEKALLDVLENGGSGTGFSNSAPQSGLGTSSSAPNPINIFVADNGSQQISKPPARRFSGRWVWFALIVSSFILGGGYLLFQNSNDRISPIFAFLQAPTAENTPIPVIAIPSNTIVPPSETPTPPPTETATPPATITSRPPTSTPSPSPTIPTQTPLPTPVAIGGSRMIAFSSDRTGIPQVYVMNVDGSNLRQLTLLPGGACQPDWAPDGSRLVFISPCLGEQEEYPGAVLLTVDLDGSEMIPLLEGSPLGDYDPDWSPDGFQIAFTSLRNNTPQIHILDLLDERVTQITDIGLINFQPEWSPGGDQIAFVTSRRGPFQVWFTTPDGFNQEGFSRSAGLKNTNPSWSPDGRFLVFAQREQPEGIPSLVRALVEENGFSEVKLTTFGNPSRTPQFSPDGKYVIFESWPSGENHDIYIIQVDTQELVRLTDDPAFDFDPAWQPSP